jgi:SEC-C motif-containing protein
MEVRRGTLRRMREFTVRRHLDAGQPLVVDHDPHGSFLVTMTACTDPRCTCTTVDLELTPADEADLDSAPSAGIAFDVATRDVTAVEDADGVLGTDDAWIRARLAGDVGTKIADRFARLRASKDRRTWQSHDWSTHTAGDTVAFYDLFPHDWDLVVTVSERRAWIIDLYCVRASCSCQEVVLQVADLGTGRSIGDARVRLAGRDRLTVHSCDPTARPFVEAALGRYRIGPLLHKRFHEMRHVARRLKTWRGDIAHPETSIETLLARRADIDDDALERVHALGEHVVLQLAAVVLDDNAEAQRRQRAARLLAAVDEPSAARALAVALVWPGLGDDIEAVEDVIHSLIRLRGHALDSVLDVLSRAGAFEDRVVDVLADLRIADERILSLIAPRARKEPQVWCDALRWQGAEAVPLLQEILAEALAELPARCDDARAAVDALEDLGVTVDMTIFDKLEEAEEEADAIAEQERHRAEQERAAYQAALAELARRPRPGRNQPCWCGSGEKYKKCHLTRDDAERQALAQQMSGAART